MTKKILILILSVFVLLYIQAKPLIICTINPYSLIVKDIVQYKMDVRTLLPVNASPHTYSPKPSDIYNMQKADLFIANGLHLEEMIIQKAKSMNINVLIVGNTLKSFGLDDNGNVHIWLSFNFINTIIDSITFKICELDSVNKQFYIDNAKQIKDNMHSIFICIKQQADTLNIKDIIIYHNSFYYFLKDLGINILGVFEKHPGREITPKELESLIKIIKDNQLPVIFSEPNINNKSVNIVKDELNIKVKILDPLGNYFTAESIYELYEYNWQEILEGYSDRD